jgi:hypothetical protein
MFKIIKNFHINSILIYNAEKFFCTISESNAETFKKSLEIIKNTYKFLNQDNDKYFKLNKNDRGD